MDLTQLEAEVNKLKDQLAGSYIPQHFDNVVAKIGSIDRQTHTAMDSMNFCFYVSLFTCTLFLVTVMIGIYVLWKLNYFKFLLRQNRFGRFARARTCYSCYRPWKRHSRTETTMKSYLSSPELQFNHSTPLPLPSYSESE